MTISNRTILKVVQPTSKLLLTAFALLTALTALITLSTPAVYAEPASASTLTELRDHCKKVTIKVLDTSCENETNLKHASNVATYKCSDKSTNKKYECILGNARDYITQAARSKPKPDNTSEFDAALDKVLMKAAGGDRSKVNKPTDDSQESQSPTSPSGCVGGKCLDPAADPSAKCTSGGCDLIKKYVNPLLNLLSVSFGLIAVISIIIGGIQYTASSGDPQKVTEAKKRIVATLVAVFAYFFLYAFLQFLVPGGIFNR